MLVLPGQLWDICRYFPTDKQVSRNNATHRKWRLVRNNTREYLQRQFPEPQILVLNKIHLDIFWFAQLVAGAVLDK